MTQENPSPATDWFANLLPEARWLDLTSPIASMLAMGLLLAQDNSPIDCHIAVTTLAAAGLEPGPHHWSLMFPTTSRVPPIVYESLVGAGYPELVSRLDNPDQFQFGTGTWNSGRTESHGFRYIYWYDANKRVRREERRGRKPRETPQAVRAAYQVAHEMCAHLNAFDPDHPADTPGQLLMTNTNHQRSSLFGSKLSPSVPCRCISPQPALSWNPLPLLLQRGPQGLPGIKKDLKAKEPRKAVRIPLESQSKSKYLTRVPLRVENTVKLAGCHILSVFLDTVSIRLPYRPGQPIRS